MPFYFMMAYSQKNSVFNVFQQLIIRIEILFQTSAIKLSCKKIDNLFWAMQHCVFWKDISSNTQRGQAFICCCRLVL